MRLQNHRWAPIVFGQEVRAIPSAISGRGAGPDPDPATQHIGFFLLPSPGPLSLTAAKTPCPDRRRSAPSICPVRGRAAGHASFAAEVRACGKPRSPQGGGAARTTGREDIPS